MGEQVQSKHSNKSQTARLLALLKENGEATNVELNRVIGFRYGGRIFELRREGHRILTVREEGSLRRYVYMGHVDEATDVA